jgi:hypothetical protein
MMEALARSQPIEFNQSRRFHHRWGRPYRVTRCSLVTLGYPSPPRGIRSQSLGNQGRHPCPRTCVRMLRSISRLSRVAHRHAHVQDLLEASRRTRRVPGKYEAQFETLSGGLISSVKIRN